MSNSILKILPALTVAITAAGLTEPVFAGAIPTISITENSSVSLSAAYNGSAAGISVSNMGPDQWTITFPLTIQMNISTVVGWIEPENPLRINFILGGFPGSVNQLFVNSDLPPPPRGISLFQDGVITSSPIATDISNPLAPINIYAVFHDQAARVEAPDAGSTLALFCFSFIALLGVKRLRCRTGGAILDPRYYLISDV